MYHLTSVRKTIIELVSVLLVTSCAAESASFDKLCGIYKTVSSESISIDEKEGKIAEEIQRKYPDFFQAEFVHIVRIDFSGRYAALKTSVELVSKSAWECPSAQKYYKN